MGLDVKALKGEVKVQFGCWSVHFFWPHVVKTNVDVGIRADTRVLFKWFNNWSTNKYRSFVLMLLGFGVGISKDFEAT